MQTKLIIVRHGITDWSVEKRYCGRTDIPLNNSGKKQAAELCRVLSSEKIDAVYTSSAKRAHEFAKIAFEKLPIAVMPELNEMAFGIFEGLTYDEIMRKHHEIYTKWIEDPSGEDIPEGESMGDFKKRIESAFKKIIRHGENKTSAVITHAGTIKMIISNILAIEDIWKTKLEWGCIAAIVAKNEKEGKWVRSPLF